MAPRLTAWARAHGNRFYNFRGLEAFRSKMEPHAWETIYAIAAEPQFSPVTLNAVARAFCHGSPFRAITAPWRRRYGRRRAGCCTVARRPARSSRAPGGHRSPVSSKTPATIITTATAFRADIGSPNTSQPSSTAVTGARVKAIGLTSEIGPACRAP